MKCFYCKTTSPLYKRQILVNVDRFPEYAEVLICKDHRGADIILDKVPYSIVPSKSIDGYKSNIYHQTNCPNCNELAMRPVDLAEHQCFTCGCKFVNEIDSISFTVVRPYRNLAQIYEQNKDKQISDMYENWKVNQLNKTDKILEKLNKSVDELKVKTDREKTLEAIDDGSYIRLWSEETRTL